MISAAEATTTSTVCPCSGAPASSKLISVKGGVREPSAPKKSKPRPISATCTATETISSTSTEALASGWKARR